MSPKKSQAAGSPGAKARFILMFSSMDLHSPPRLRQKKIDCAGKSMGNPFGDDTDIPLFLLLSQSI